MTKSELTTNIPTTANSARYKVEDFIPFIEQASAALPRSTMISSDPLTNIMVDSVTKNCAFIQHFRDDAETLGYQDWFAGITNLSLCSDGAEKIHEWSRSYPHYSSDETQKMIDSAREAQTPVTCEYIRNTLGFKGCPSCPVKAPIAWGASGLGRALDVVDTFTEKLKSDPTLTTQELPFQITSALKTIYVRGASYLFDGTISKLKESRPKLNMPIVTSHIKALVERDELDRDKQRTQRCCDQMTTDMGYPVKIPAGYQITSENGIEKVSKDKKTLILPRIVIPTKRYHYPGNELIGLKFQKGQGYLNIIVPRTTLASSSRVVELSAYGIPIDTSTALGTVPFFTKFLLENETDMPYLTATPHLGWQEDGSFLPCLSAVRLIKIGDETDSTDSLKPSGTLEEWIAVMSPLRQYIGARLAMAASMSGPILQLLGIRTFIVHLWGPSQSGKTASQKAALSIWLNPAAAAGNMVSFNSTRVALETTLGYLKNLPFMINERQQVGKEQSFLDQLLYMLSEGQGRSRGARNGGLRRVCTWQTTIITSGEHPLTTAGSAEGERTRTLEIFANSFIGDNTLASKMHSLSEHYYGTAGITVLRYAIGNTDTIMDKFQAFKAFILATNNTLPGSYYDYIAVLAVSELLISKVIFKHTDKEAHNFAEELTAHVVSSLPANIPEYQQAYIFLQDWVSQHMDQFDYSSIHRAGWINGNDIFFFPLAFDAALEEGGFHPSRVRRDFAGQNILRRSPKEFTITRTDSATNRPTRVIMLPSFLTSKEESTISTDVDGPELIN